MSEYRPLPPSVCFVEEEDFCGQKLIVMKCPEFWSLRDVQQFVASVWRSYEKQGGSKERFFPFTPLDARTRKLRMQYIRVKEKYRSKNKKRKRTSEAKRLHDWIHRQFLELRRKRIQGLTKAEAAEMINERLSSHIEELRAAGLEAPVLLSIPTIRKLLSTR